MKDLAAERLRALWHYEPATGAFTRRLDVHYNAKRGASPTYLNSSGYVCFRVDGRLYRAHRLAVLYMTDAMPEGDVDHINGIRTDNRWSNLRVVTRAVNLQNRRALSGNRSGLLGVTWCKTTSKWRAQIGVDGRMRCLGRYASPSDAHEAYLSAKRRLHEGCTI